MIALAHESGQEELGMEAQPIAMSFWGFWVVGQFEQPWIILLPIWVEPAAWRAMLQV
jgi:hypothetical protein